MFPLTRVPFWCRLFEPQPFLFWLGDSVPLPKLDVLKKSCSPYSKLSTGGTWTSNQALRLNFPEFSWGISLGEADTTKNSTEPTSNMAPDRGLTVESEEQGVCAGVMTIHSQFG